MNEPHPARWKPVICLGIASVLVSLFLLFFAEMAAELVTAFAGIVIILLAGVFLTEGIFLESTGWPRWVILGIGIIGIIAGLLAIIVPSLVIVSAGILLGTFLVIYGCGELVVGISVVFAETMVRMVFIMLGLFSIIVGTFFVLHPARGADVLVGLLGLYLLVLGLMRIARGLNEREAEGSMTIKRL